MTYKVLNLILDEDFLKQLKNDASKNSITIEEYVIKVLEEFNNVN